MGAPGVTLIPAATTEPVASMMSYWLAGDP